MQKNSKEIFTKLIAMLLIITLNIANFLFVGEGLISYAVDMVATNSNNVEFQVYFKNQDETTKQEIQVAEKDININSESENLYVTISVLREGYFNGKITLDSNNLSVIGCTKNAYLNSVDGNTINLNQIGSGNTVTLELQVKPKTANSIKSADLSAESIVNLTGVYTSSKGTKLVTTDIKGKTTVKANLKSPENIQNILETNIITNKVFEIDGVNKRIIQILVKNNAKDNLYPIKTTNIEMKLPSDAEKIVAYARSTESTDSRINFGESNYNQEESTLKINLENKEDSEGNISFAKNATDSLVVTAIYNESKVFTEEEKVITTKSTITTYDEKALITEKQATISEEVKGIINYEISKQEDAIYKGKIYTGEEREYKVNVRSYVNSTLTAESIKFKLDTTKYLVGEIEKESTIAYKDITIKKDDFTKVLGENANINILNQEGTVVSSITNETEVDQKGNIVISLPENTLKADIETSVPTATGKIDFILTKSIVENTYQEDEIKTFTDIENAITTEDEIKVKGNTELKETITQAKLDIDTKELKAGTTTTVEITTTLLSDDETKDLYKNPVIKIAFPANTTQLTEPKYKILYTNGLEETAEGKVTEEDGRKVVIITLKGEQKTYPGKTIQGTVVVVSAELTVDKLQTSSNENITLTYTNENAKNYYQDGKITKDLKIVQDQNIIITNNIKELGVETVGKEEDKEVNIKATGETQTATIQIGAISNEEETITNAKILGKFPTKSSTNTMDITLTSNIKVTTGQEGVKIYYSSNENATEDLENSENAWTEDSNLADKRCYLIVVPSLNKGEKICAEYGVAINTTDIEDKKAEESFKIIYNIDEKNTKYSESTQNIFYGIENQEVKVEMTISYIENNQEVSSNTYHNVFLYITNMGNTDLENIDIKFIANELFDIKDFFGYGLDENNTVKIERIKAGEVKYISLRLRVKERTTEVNKATIYAEVEANGKKYITNTISEKVKYVKGEMSVDEVISSENDGDIVRVGDSINYKIKIKNTGKDDMSKLNLSGVISKYLSIKNVNIEGKKAEYILNKMDKEMQSEIEIPIDRVVKEGESIEIEIETKVKTVDIIVDDIMEIKNILYLYNDIDKIDIVATKNLTVELSEKDNTKDEDKDNNTDKSETDNGNLDNSDNQDDNNVEDSSYRINGKVWLDKGKTGEKNSDSDNISGVKVRLIDIQTGKVAIAKNGYEISAMTNDDGEYTLANIEEGNYIVVFDYDTNKYKPTVYQKDGISDAQNSDAILKDVEIDGEIVNIAATNTLNINSNLNNIDLGLIEVNNFKLEINKTIEKIEVTNTDGIKTYSFDNSSLAKVEIASKKLNNSRISIEYNIKVKNTGDISGYTKDIVDYMPKELEFDSDKNENWRKQGDYLYNSAFEDKELKPGEEKEVKLILTKTMTESNTGLISNIVEVLGSDSDEMDKKGENKSQANVIIGVKTGGVVRNILIILFTFIIIVGIIVLKNKRKNNF